MATEFIPTNETNLLVVLPHPDDETFAAGGTIARTVDAGGKATYICGTWGDMGRRLGRPPFATRESLRDIRSKELDDALEILGCDLRHLGIRDKCVEFEDPEEIAARVRRVIDEVKPNVMITFYPGFGVHPDHDALGHITVLALRGMDKESRPPLYAVAVGGEEHNFATLGSPDVISDIREFNTVKLDALRAHASQTQAMFNNAAQDGMLPRMRDEERFYIIDPDKKTLLE